MKYIWNRRQLDLESELRASRPEPRADFVKALAGEVRSEPLQRARAGRIGLAFALSGLIVVVLASFGGIGYASSAARHAVKKPATAKHVRIASTSAAQAQYAPFTPPTAPFTPPKTKTKPITTAGTTGTTGTGSTGTAQTGGTKATASQLPFTGLALWVPLAVGLMLISLGLVLRTRGRRRHTGAH